MKLYHLSHIDLDGYGCQYITTSCFENINCYNANYGAEVLVRFQEMIDDIETNLDTKEEQIIILITDINLSFKESKKIENEACRVGAGLQLLDHHSSGEKTANKFPWYHLDISKCATSLTYDWLIKRFNFDENRKFLDIVNAINAIDIWLDKEPFFEYGKVMLGMVSRAREINRILFPNFDREFKLYLIEKSKSILNEENAPITLDNQLHSIKKSFFIKDIDNTKDNLVSNYITKLLTQNRERYTIYYKDNIGILAYNVGSSSIIGNACMVENSDYDFYMDVGSRGYFSLRSNNKMNVAQMALEIGKGGGHPNASGGKIENYKDSFIYEDIKLFIQNYLDSRV